MKSAYSVIPRGALALAVAASLVAAVPAFSQPSGATPTAQEQAVRQDRMRQHMQTRLNNMAKQLEIKDWQQPAWAEYTRTVESIFTGKPARPPAEADAAAIVRHRAQQMVEHAQKMNQLADATARLQDALDPPQRKTLTEIVRKRGPGGHHKHRHNDRPQGNG